jgi:hypothetical protein
VRDSMPRVRIFEHTDDWTGEQFDPGGTLDTERMTTLPALFVSETSGTGDQKARVGTKEDNNLLIVFNSECKRCWNNRVSVQ